LAGTIRKLCAVYFVTNDALFKKNVDYTFGKMPALPVKMVLAAALNRNWAVTITCDKVSSYDTSKPLTLIPACRRIIDTVNNR